MVSHERCVINIGVAIFAVACAVAVLFVAVIRFVLLQPSWWALVWIGLYAVIATLRVRTEEAHLRRIYCEEYERYCARVPRCMELGL